MSAPYKKIYLQQGIEGERTWEESSVYENDDIYYHSSEIEALKSENHQLKLDHKNIVKEKREFQEKLQMKKSIEVFSSQQMRFAIDWLCELTGKGNQQMTIALMELNK